MWQKIELIYTLNEKLTKYFEVPKYRNRTDKWAVSLKIVEIMSFTVIVLFFIKNIFVRF